MGVGIGSSRGMGRAGRGARGPSPSEWAERVWDLQRSGRQPRARATLARI